MTNDFLEKSTISFNNYKGEQQLYLSTVLHYLPEHVYGPAKDVWDAISEDRQNKLKQQAKEMHETLLEYRRYTAECNLDLFALKGNDAWLVLNSMLVLAAEGLTFSTALQEQLIHDENLKSRLLFPEQAAKIRQLTLYQDEGGEASIKKSSNPLPIYIPTDFETQFFLKHFNKLALKLLFPVPATVVRKFLAAQNVPLFIAALRSIIIAEIAPLAYWDEELEEVFIRQSHFRQAKVGYMAFRLLVYLYLVHVLKEYKLVSVIKNEDPVLFENVFAPKNLLLKTKYTLEKFGSAPSVVSALYEIELRYGDALEAAAPRLNTSKQPNIELFKAGQDIVEAFRVSSFKKELHKFKGADGSWYNSVKYIAVDKFNNELLLQDVTVCGAFPSGHPVNYFYVSQSIHGNHLSSPDDTLLASLGWLQVSLSSLNILLNEIQFIPVIASLQGKSENKITHAQRRQFIALLIHLKNLQTQQGNLSPLLDIFVSLNFDFRGRMYFMFPAGPHFNRLSRILFSSTPCKHPRVTFSDMLHSAWLATLHGCPKSYNTFAARDQYWTASLSTDNSHLTLQTINHLALFIACQKLISADQTLSISLDATSSGPQCIGALLGDQSLLEATNIVALEPFTRNSVALDLYGILLQRIREHLKIKEVSNEMLIALKNEYYENEADRRVIDQRDYTQTLYASDKKLYFTKLRDEQKDVIQVLLQYFIQSTACDRTLIKMLIVPEVYGKTAPAAKKDLRSEIFTKDAKLTIVNETFELSKFSYKIKLLLIEAFYNHYQKVKQSTFPALDKYTLLTRFIATNLQGYPLSWTTPDGVNITNKIYLLAQQQFKVRGTGRQARGSIRLKIVKKDRSGQPIIDTVSLTRGFGVNFIHSLDAYIARSVVQTFISNGYTVATVHDCFLTHPTHFGLLYSSYDDSFIQAIKHGRDELLRLLIVAEKNAKPTSTLTKEARPVIEEFKAVVKSGGKLGFHGPFLFF